MERGGGRGRYRHRHKHKHRHRHKHRYRYRHRQNSNSNSNSKTLILKDSSARSIWTYLTASSCFTTNTTIPQTIISTIKQSINAVSQFLQLCINITIKFLPWAYMYTEIKFLGKRMIQTNPSKFNERLFSDVY